MMANKSYWQTAYIGNASAKAAVKSWFGPLCEGMIPYKAEILCDVETDREKKVRAFMADADGKCFQFERTLGRKTFSVSRKRIVAVVGGARE
jgi:hypothetical protein